MTIRSTPPISLGDVMAELRTANPGRQFPLSLGDADVRALAGVPSGPISLGNLYGKSAYIPMTGQGINDAATGNSSFSGGVVACYPGVQVNGGKDPKTFAWSITSGTGATLSSANSQYCTVSRTFMKNANGAVSLTLACLVTDATGQSITIGNVFADLEWTNNN